MDLALLLDQVLPPSSVLAKACHGSFDFYLSDLDWNEGKVYMSQTSDEDVHHFLERLVQQLIKDEEGDDEPLVTIDYSIWSNFQHRPQTGTIV